MSQEEKMYRMRMFSEAVFEDEERMTNFVKAFSNEQLDKISFAIDVELRERQINASIPPTT